MIAAVAAVVAACTYLYIDRAGQLGGAPVDRRHVLYCNVNARYCLATASELSYLPGDPLKRLSRATLLLA